MSISRLLRAARGAGRERRKSPRVQCRLSCQLRKGRRWIPARVLDVSEGGLCVLTPLRLQPRQRVRLRVDVPRKGPVDVEAVAWHVREVKSGRAHRRAWSVGMEIEKAGTGFAALLPTGSRDVEFDDASELSSKLAELGASRGPLRLGGAGTDDVLEEDSLGEEELAQVDLDLLSREELEAVCTTRAAAERTLLMFRVRVKARSGPRTKTLTIGAVSSSEAEEMAHSELGESWQVLGVERA